MKIVVITNNTLKEELLAQGMRDNVQAEWLADIDSREGVNGYIDLLFDGSAERTGQLKALLPAPVIVNAVNADPDILPPGFIRINGWNGFLKRPLTEAAGNDSNKPEAEKILTCFNKKTEWVPNVRGFITPRIISMIINEAFYTLDEKVSSKQEIDTAMKLGTNYPYGPFEWGNMIGLKNIYELLASLTRTNSRYQPSVLLKKEALL